MYLLGYDIGSSSVKASIIDSQTGALVGSATCPGAEMPINAPKPGWAEQDPQRWWDEMKNCTAALKGQGIDLAAVGAIGVAYQMHGLVIVDKELNVLRPAIIWCDSRAVAIGDAAFEALGADICLGNCLNSPGNFTASKLKWVKDNEPDIYARIHKAMLPGDYAAMMLTGDIRTTQSGLSEGIMWNFANNMPATIILDQYDIDPALLPEIVPTFYEQGVLLPAVASELGLSAGIPVGYRAGDQPNNAFSLNVLNPGELAATAGTSGVVYGVTDQANYDPQSRVNTFVHVSHTNDTPRNGILMCLNGTGILNSWVKHNIVNTTGTDIDYPAMNDLAAQVPVGSDGVVILPYGNGAERTLVNREIGSSMHGVSFTTHTKAHMVRAAQEGIVFALNYGVEIMKGMGLEVSLVRAGKANMFQSPIFAETFAAVTGAEVLLYDTDGSQGAARGAGVGAGAFNSPGEAFHGLNEVGRITPPANKDEYVAAYGQWKEVLDKELAEVSADQDTPVQAESIDAQPNQDGGCSSCDSCSHN